MQRRRPLIFWTLVCGGLSFAAHGLGAGVAAVMYGFLQAPSELGVVAAEVRAAMLPGLRRIAFPAVGLLSVIWVWPLLRFGLSSGDVPASESVRRAAAGMPLVYGGLGLLPWLVGSVISIGRTVLLTGTWSVALLSEQVFTPIISGTMASLLAYLSVEWVVRTRIAPLVFAAGHIEPVAGIPVMGVRTKLLVLVGALGVVPLFSIAGLVQAARARVRAGYEAGEVLSELVSAAGVVIAVQLPVGLAFTLLFARSLTVPLVRIARALGRIEAGNLATDAVGIGGGADEVGVVGRGVDALAASLRERERILGTFGRLVEPAVRDRLLAGGLRPGGERREAAVLFADLRGFTAMNEAEAPEVVITTLNEFFAASAAAVHESGGFIDKFLGDAVLAVYGLFDEVDADPAPRALAGASLLALKIVAINRKREARGERPLAIRMGLAAGPVLAGTVGAAERYEYTVVGDTVNIAARLLELGKERDCDLIATATAIERARRAGVDVDVLATEQVSLRGRRAPLEVGCVRLLDPRSIRSQQPPA